MDLNLYPVLVSGFRFQGTCRFQVSVFRCQESKTAVLKPDCPWHLHMSWHLTPDTSILGYGPALRERFIIYTILCRFLGYLPAPLSLRNFPLQCFLQSIQHANAFFVAAPKFKIRLFCNVSFEFCHEQVMNCLTCFSSATIHTFDLITWNLRNIYIFL